MFRVSVPFIETVCFISTTSIELPEIPPEEAAGALRLKVLVFGRAHPPAVLMARYSIRQLTWVSTKGEAALQRFNAPRAL